MRREEVFALGAGVICLAVNAVLVTLVITPERVRDAPLLAPVVLGAVIYGWLLVAWMLVRRTLVQKRRKQRPNARVRLSRSDLRRTALTTVAGMAMVMAPVLFSIFGTRFPMTHPMLGSKLGGAADPMAWGVIVGAMSIGTLVVCGVAVFYAITLLMPVVYTDVRHE
jgi:hypothetical protein